MVILTAPEAPERQVKILATVEVPSTSPGREGKKDIQVTYRIGAYQVFSTFVPSEEFTEEKLKDVIRKDAAQKAKFIGLEFTL